MYSQAVFFVLAIFAPFILSPTSGQYSTHALQNSYFIKMPKDKVKSFVNKAAKYEHYKHLEEQKLFAGVRKLVSLKIYIVNNYCHNRSTTSHLKPTCPKGHR